MNNIIIFCTASIFLLLTAVALKKIKWGIYSLIALEILLPQSVQVVIGSFRVPLDFILIVVFFMIFLLKQEFKNSTTTLPCKVRNYVLLYICVSLLFSLFSSFPLFSQWKNVFRFVIQNVFSAYMLFSIIRNSKDINTLCRIIFLSTFVACIYGLLTYIIKSNPYVEIITSAFGSGERNNVGFSFIEEQRGIIKGRIMATMIHPLQWGQSLTCIFPVLLFFYKAKVFLISKSLFLTGMTFVLVNIFLSGSRSAMVALLLFGCIYFLQVEFKKRIRFLTVFVIFFILFCVSESKFLEQMLDIVTSSVIFWNDSYSDAVGIQGSSVAMRLGQLYGTFESISNNPLFGMGKGYVTYQSFDSNDGTSGMFGYESVFFYKMVEEGVLGTFCFFLMYYKLYAATIKQIKKSNILRNFKRIVSGHYLSYLVAILFTGIQGSFTLFTLLSISIISFTVLQNSKNQSLSSFTVSSK